MVEVSTRSAKEHARELAVAARARADRWGWHQSERGRLRDAASYWTEPTERDWQANSHWQGAFGDSWSDIGRETLDISLLLARLLEAGLPVGRTVEWGAGGGANAVHFAPLCREFVAADIAAPSLVECARQVAAVCDTPVRTQLIAPDDPEATVAALGAGSCDLFLCFYVLELVPSPAYGLRLLAIAQQLLRSGGVAIVQIKYATADPLSRPRRRGYRRHLSDMTTYGIDEFWIEAARHGLSPLAVRVVPRNRLDRRYAYYLLVKSDD